MSDSKVVSLEFLQFLHKFGQADGFDTFTLWEAVGARMHKECSTWLDIVQGDPIAFLQGRTRTVFDFHRPDPVFPTHFQNEVDFRASGSSVKAPHGVRWCHG